MGREIDELKWSAWRRRLARFERSGRTVSSFCRAENVSMPSFFQWRRKLARAGEHRPGLSSRERSSFEPPTFLPVRIEAAPTVEIELPNGARIRLPARELAAIDAAVAAAGRMVPTSDEESSRC